MLKGSAVWTHPGKTKTVLPLGKRSTRGSTVRGVFSGQLLRKATAALWPPKPKLEQMAT